MDRLAVHMERGGPCLVSGFSIPFTCWHLGDLGSGWLGGLQQVVSWEGRRTRKLEFEARFLSWETEAVA